MRIQQLPSQNFYGIQSYYRPAVNTLAFRGEVGDEFVKGIKDGSLADSEDIKNLMSNVSRMGFVPESQAEDILESAVRYSKDLWQRKLDLDKRWDDITEAEEVMAAEVVNYAKAKYNVPNNKETYDNNAEQTVLVTQFLNSIKDKLTNTKPSTQKDVLSALRNKDNVISDNDFEILKRIIESYGTCNASLLPEIIKSVKDEDGNFDLEKTAAFIAYSCYCPGANPSSAIDFVKNNCNPVQQVGFELNEDLYNRMETFINQINESTDMKDLIKSLGLKKMGIVPAFKIRDILSMIAEFNKEHNRKAKYNVIRAANVSDQDENIAKAESFIRTIYNIEDPEVTTYNTLPEQMYVLGKFINENSKTLTSVTETAAEDILKVLKNDEGTIRAKDINLLKTILEMGEKTCELSNHCELSRLCEIYLQVKDFSPEEFENVGRVIKKYGFFNPLPKAIEAFKNQDGSLNPDKVEAFFAYLSAYNTSRVYSDAVDFIERSNFGTKANKNENPDVKTYNTLAEQINAVSGPLKEKKDQLVRANNSTMEDILHALQNNEGIITDKDIDFLTKVLDFRKETEALLLPSAIRLVKDKDGNLDSEKVTAFFGYYGWENASLLSVLQTMNEEYNSNSPEMARQIDNAAEIIEKDIAAKKAAEAAAAAAERAKVEKLAQRFREEKNAWGRTNYSRVEIDSDGLISLRFSETGGVFFASVIGYDPDWVLQHVKSIDFADTVNLSGATSIGALRYIDADHVYWAPYDIYKAEVTGKIETPKLRY